MGWFQRNTEGIKTKSDERKEMPEGAWYKCPSCKTVVSSQDHENSLFGLRSLWPSRENRFRRVFQHSV